jgi:geranylgeranyl pyrophosphate synthase
MIWVNKHKLKLLLASTLNLKRQIQKELIRISMKMAPEEKLMQRAIHLIEKRGQRAVELSKQLAVQDVTKYEPLNNAIKYFMDEFWFDYLHPALISLACEAVGGNLEDSTTISAAFVLLAGAADIHDDIIDESKMKEPQLTVYGKFGRDIAVLSGDAILLRGLYVLNEALEPISRIKKKMILESVRQAFLELCGGEAREASWRGKVEIPKEDYLEIIKQKAAASEAATRVGAIIGGGTKKEVELLSHYGRTYGILFTLRNEFIDVFEPDELRNRLENECLPLPVLIAFHDESRKTQILQLLKKELTEEAVEKILDLSMDFQETRILVEDMKEWVKSEISIFPQTLHNKKELKLMLQATIEDI